MRVSSIKYQFCASVHPMRYDVFDIKGAKGLEAMLQMHIDIVSPFLELYLEFSSPDEGIQLSTSLLVLEARMEPSVNGLEVALFFKLEPVPIEPEDGERGKYKEEEDPRFMAYSPLTYMQNVDLSVNDELEFTELPHRKPSHASSSLDSGDLEVGKEFSTKDGFLAVVNLYSIKMLGNVPIL
ncbi:hypothetical protein PVK06_043373 [Gossypium arboreum]|uniref:Uncharacterized protein n=1 Tax=Gossypium arboreum TaxID=29729 RepID=A0ABR0MNK3_GOSAR|nr:hypothetical protein PVK06_043373 [Gossypium arboreum]